jgi:hypothetical protein
VEGRVKESMFAAYMKAFVFLNKLVYSLLSIGGFGVLRKGWKF